MRGYALSTLAAFFLLIACDQQPGSKMTGCAGQRPSDASILTALNTALEENGWTAEKLNGVAADCGADGARAILYIFNAGGNLHSGEGKLLRSEDGKWHVVATVGGSNLNAVVQQ